jgi:hypothetical protein
MLITYYSTPRQVGKTTIGMYEAIKCPDSIMLAHDGRYARELSDRHKHLKAMSYYDFFRDGGTRIYKNIIIDEYHYASLIDREKLHSYVLSFKKEIDNVFVFTTPRIQMPDDMYYYIASCKAKDIPLEQAINIKYIKSIKPKWFLLPLDYKGLQVMIHELWFDLLFLDCSRHTIGDLKIKFYDGDDRMPFFNYTDWYKTMANEMNDDERFEDWIKPYEITGQFIVK